MTIRALTSAVVLVLFAQSQGVAQSKTPCVLAGAASLAPVSAFDTATIEVRVSFTSAPDYQQPVPIRVGYQGDCRVHVSPSSGVQQFRIRLEPTLAEGAAVSPDTALLRLQVVPWGAAQSVVEMDPLEVRSGTAVLGTFRLNAALTDAAEYELAFRVTRVRDNKQSDLPFRLLWTPSVKLDLGGPVADCPTPSVCVTAGLDSEISVTGPGLSQVDLARPVKLTSSSLSSSPISVPLAAGNSNTPTFRVSFGNAGVGTLEAEIPLASARLRVTGAGVEDVRSLTVTKPLVVQTRPVARAEVRGGDGELLKHLTLANSAVPVSIGAASQDFLQYFQPGGIYRIREWTNGRDEGKSVAEFLFDRYERGKALGAIRALSTTTVQPRYDLAPRLELLGQGADRRLEVQMIVLPQPTVNQYVLIRGATETPRGSVYPTERLSLRLEGPAVAYVQRAELNGIELKGKAGTTRDALAFENFGVPRSVDGVARLRLWDLNGEELTSISIPVVPAARALTDRLATFAWIQRTDDGKVRTIPLDTGRAELSDFRGLSLRVDPDQVEPGNTELAGVQYISITATLRDFEGTQHGQRTVCLAVVPPPVNGRAYPFDSGCTPVIGGEYSLSEMIDATPRAAAQSSLEIQIGHDLSKYTGAYQPNTRRVSLVRKGRFPIIPSVALPGMMMTFQRGRNWRADAAVAYTGALIGTQPLFGNFGPKSALSVTLGTGFLIKTPPKTQEATNSLSAQLSWIAAGSLRIKDISGKLSFEMMLGYMQPLDGRFRARDGQIVLYPGFKLNP